ncbi:MAG: hypothetical protein ACYS5V_13530 [Planctomycetota bacterium]
MLGVLVMVGAAASAPSAQRSGASIRELLMWACVAMAAVLLLGLVVVLIRRAALSPDSRPPAQMAVEQVEQLHRDGALSDEEYRRARRLALGLPVADQAPADRSQSDTDAQEKG